MSNIDVPGSPPFHVQTSVGAGEERSGAGTLASPSVAPKNGDPVSSPAPRALFLGMAGNFSPPALLALLEGGIDVCAVVLTPWPPRPDAIERSNRETIARLGAVEVETLPRVAGPATDELARAGGELPWRRWLADSAERQPLTRLPAG